MWNRHISRRFYQLLPATRNPLCPVLLPLQRDTRCALLFPSPLLWSSTPLFGSRLHKCVHPLGWSREPSWLEGGEKKKKKEEGKKGRKRRRKATKDVLTDASRSGIGFPLTSWWNICPDSWKMTRVISPQVAHTSFGFFYAIRTCILGTRAWQESDSTRFFVWRRSKHYNSLSLSLSRPQIYTVI